MRNNNLSPKLIDLIERGIRFEGFGSHLRIHLGRETLAPDVLADLKSTKSEILAYLDQDAIACLSYSQARLWFLDQIGFGNQYHIPGVGHIRGPLNVKLLQQSIQAIMDRHESLRTNFVSNNGVPFQRIQRKRNFDLEQIDLTDLPISDRRPRHDDIVASLAKKTFNLAEDSLVRGMLLKLSKDEFTLILCFHHIISDGWSMKLFLQEMAENYDSLIKQGRLKNRPPQTLQYSGFAAWQRQTLNEELLSDQLKFWKRELSGYKDLDIPTDFVRPDQLSGDGQTLAVSLPVSQSDGIKAFCKANGLSTFALYLTSVSIALASLCNQADFCLGIPVANRTNPEIENLIGFFVNTIVLRINLPTTRPISHLEMARWVQDQFLTIQEHQLAPIEKVLEVVKPPRNISRNPIFQVLVNYTPSIAASYEIGDCQLQPILSESNTAKFEITFSFNEIQDGDTTTYIEYATDIFSPKTISRLGEAVRKNLNRIVSNPSELVSTNDSSATDTFVDDAQDFIFNDIDYPRNETIQSLFAKSALINPKKPAIVSDSEGISYQELDQRSSSIAAKLKSNGVLPGDIVSIVADRSPTTIVGVLSILKSGAAYLPLDPSYPTERLRFMLQDSKSKWILLQSKYFDSLKGLLDETCCTEICIDHDSISVQPHDTFHLLDAKSDSLAYIIYTSGTTGDPKGVMIEHRSVVNHSFSVIDRYQLHSSDRVLQFSTPCFDIFVEEVFPTLISGGTIILLDKGDHLSASYLRRVIHENQVTVANFPTSFWHAISNQGIESASLRLVIVGGEELKSNVVLPWRKRNPHIALINTYGPTEATVICSTYKIEGQIPKDIPIGQPIANTVLHVLDSELRPVPMGVAGELYVAGDCLARGYLNNPLLTAEKFIENPSVKGQRMYRTGDLVKWNADRNLIFLGRKDSQVKIRGYRIELDEIERFLNDNPSIEGSAVVSFERNGANDLAAFYVPRTDSIVSSTILQEYLLQRLPQYMIPNVWVPLEKLPLNMNGKVDRKQLKSHLDEWLESTSNKTFDAKTISQDVLVSNKFGASRRRWIEYLSRLWSNVLRHEKINVYDNFFDIGGHSLLAVQLAGMIINDFPSLSLQVVDLLKKPTIFELSGHLESLESSDSNSHSLKILPTLLRSTEMSFIVPGLPGVSDYYFELAELWPSIGPVYGLTMLGHKADSPNVSIEEMAAFNLQSIKSIFPRGKINFIAHSYGGTILYEMLRQLTESELEINQIVLLDCSIHRPLNTIEVDTAIDDFAATFLAPIPKTDYDLRTSTDDIKVTLRNALTAHYDYGKSKLPYRVDLVIAEESLAWFDVHCWDSLFAEVTPFITKGTHQSMTRNPDALHWISSIRH